MASTSTGDGSPFDTMMSNAHVSEKATSATAAPGIMSPTRSRASSTTSLTTSSTAEYRKGDRPRAASFTTERHTAMTRSSSPSGSLSVSRAPCMFRADLQTEAQVQHESHSSPSTAIQAHSTLILPNSTLLKPTGVRSTLLAAHHQSTPGPSAPASANGAFLSSTGRVSSSEPRLGDPSRSSSPSPRNNWRSSMMGGTISSSPTTSREIRIPKNRTKGPLITRISSPAISPITPHLASVSSSSTSTSETHQFRFSSPANLHQQQFQHSRSPSASASLRPSPSSAAMRRNSSDMSQQEVEEDLALGGRTASMRLSHQRRTGDQEAVQKWDEQHAIPDEVELRRTFSTASSRGKNDSLSSSVLTTPTILSRVTMTVSREPIFGIRPSSCDGGRHDRRVLTGMSIFGNGDHSIAPSNKSTRPSVKVDGISRESPVSPSTDDWNRSRLICFDYDRQGYHHSSSLPPTPAPPTQLCPPAAEPILDDRGQPLRNYQLHGGSNRFFIGGRFLTSGDDLLPFVISFALAIIMPIMFLTFSASFIWHHLGAGGKVSIFLFIYIVALMWTNMIKTCWTDPGIIPRNLDPTPDTKWVEDIDGEGHAGLKVEPRFLRIKGSLVLTKWCETCHTYRPPRASHCRLCDNCVEHTDHHCTFLNNCIGRRNYTPFIAFLVSAILCAVWAIAFSAWHIGHQQALSRDPINAADFRRPWITRWDVIGSIVVAVIAFALLVPIFGLFTYHARLIWTNRTTIEMLRPKGDRSGAIDPADGTPISNPYKLRSVRRNVVTLLCRPVDVPNWISHRAFATRDERDDHP
ncbi:hypothetical protein MVLG_03637 [Microbotryum lychnidis-dioicae p1A1 Lamole]|uniref:Palmitoyltransferase n=1 Tax=Microbotryum lychnidis-dioicae (strain p1A1 Lamole / MvSl-1064) TaxID=683840 RepID=U5H8T8_USTV1|nr:hypothetical protein MVLG_03637 [Microbotryum lychnidis-dioicae p1A1 Lamole]|eukprot:KDE05951.1 hypothetical protein MVLG_03637 [Microbotryum lychnidis-dioicae p1A1 Lamole]